MNEHRIYARWLGFGVAVGFAALVVSFAIYLSGAVAPGIPPQDLPKYWGLPVAEYVQATGAPTGWSWVKRLGESDLMNFAGVAILGCATMLCYLRMLPIFVAARQRVWIAICVAQLVVLAVAASGILFSVH